MRSGIFVVLFWCEGQGARAATVRNKQVSSLLCFEDWIAMGARIQEETCAFHRGAISSLTKLRRGCMKRKLLLLAHVWERRRGVRVNWIELMGSAPRVPFRCAFNPLEIVDDEFQVKLWCHSDHCRKVDRSSRLDWKPEKGCERLPDSGRGLGSLRNSFITRMPRDRFLEYEKANHPPFNLTTNVKLTTYESFHPRHRICFPDLSPVKRVASSQVYSGRQIMWARSHFRCPSIHYLEWFWGWEKCRAARMLPFLCLRRHENLQKWSGIPGGALCNSACV